MKYVTSSKLLSLIGLFLFKIMKIGYMTFENDDSFVSNPKLEQLICDEIFPGCKEYILLLKY